MAKFTPPKEPTEKQFKASIERLARAYHPDDAKAQRKYVKDICGARAQLVRRYRNVLHVQREARKLRRDNGTAKITVSFSGSTK